MTPSRLRINRVSLSLACLLVPRHTILPASCASHPHKLHRQNAAKFSVNSQAGATRVNLNNMSLQYSPPIVLRPRTQHTATIITFHGLGDSGHGWSDFGAQYGSVLPHVKWIFPNAPERPITINGGMRMPGWYDILTLDKVALVEDTEGLNESSRYVQSLIAEEVAAGIPANRILVAGFSQGGAVALLTLRHNVKLAGVLGLSCYLPMASAPTVVSPENKDTPLLLGHGTYDPVIKYEFGKLTYDKLKQAGASVTFKSYDGMGHSVSPQEIKDVVEFWQKCLPAQ